MDCPADVYNGVPNIDYISNFTESHYYYYYYYYYYYAASVV